MIKTAFILAGSDIQFDARTGNDEHDLVRTALSLVAEERGWDGPSSIIGVGCHVTFISRRRKDVTLEEMEQVAERFDWFLRGLATITKTYEVIIREKGSTL